MYEQFVKQVTEVWDKLDLSNLDAGTRNELNREVHKIMCTVTQEELRPLRAFSSRAAE